VSDADLRFLTRSSVVSSNFPIEEDVFHLRTFANVMNNHVAPAPPVLLIDHDAYVRYASAQSQVTRSPGA
jgi:hypothetical protein